MYIFHSTYITLHKATPTNQKAFKVEFNQFRQKPVNIKHILWERNIIYQNNKHTSDTIKVLHFRSSGEREP